MSEEHFHSFLRNELEDFSYTYSFVTSQYGYTVYFNIDEYSDILKDYDFLHKKGYGFGFFNQKFNGERKIQDKKVGPTIEKIAEDFIQLMGIETVLLFHCDTSDSRQSFRHKVFTNWYERSSFKDRITMVSVEVEIGDKTYYIGYLTHNDNPNLNHLTQEFDSLSVRLITDK